MDKVMNLLGLENGENGTWYKILDVKKVDNIKNYPSVKNGKVISPLDHTDWYKYKITVEFTGYAVLVQGNGVCAAEGIKDTLGEGYTAVSTSPQWVQVWEKSIYESALSDEMGRRCQ